MRSNRKILEHLMQLVSEDDLRAVIKKYANSNTDFMYFLQLKFLYLMPTDEPVKKYGAFLSASFRNWLDRPDKINVTATKKIKLFSEELRQQSLDMISTKNYIEAYGILRNLLLYNSILIEKTWDRNPDLLLDIHLDILNTYHKLSEQKLGRPLKEEMLNDLRGLLITGSIKIFDIRFNALDLLISISNKDKKSDEFFIQYFDHLCLQPSKSSLTSNAVRAFLIITSLHSSRNWAKNLYDSNMINSNQFYEHCEQWLLEGKYAAALNLCESALNFVAVGSKGQFYEVLCRIKIAANDFPNAIEDLMSFASDHYTTAPMLEKALRIFPEEFRLAAKRKLSAEFLFEKMKNKKEKLSIAHLLIWLEQGPQLLKLAEIQNSSYILLPFNKYLYRNYPKQLKQFYIQYIDNYLENHIGKMSIHFAANLLDEIKKSGVHQLADQLSDHISHKYSYRKSVHHLSS